MLLVRRGSKSDGWLIGQTERAHCGAPGFQQGSPDPTNVDGLVAFVLVLLYSAVKL
jgi:hypothetical protein